MADLMQQFCRSIEHLDIPFVIITSEFHIHYASPIFAKVLGYEVSELTNQSYVPFFDIEWKKTATRYHQPLIKAIAKKNGESITAGFRVDQLDLNSDHPVGYLITLKQGQSSQMSQHVEEEPFDIEAQLFLLKVTMQEMIDPITALIARLKTFESARSDESVHLLKMTEQVEHIADLIRTVMPIIRKPDPIEWKKMICLRDLLWASEWLLKTYLKNKHVTVRINPNLLGVNFYCVYRKMAQFFILLLKVLLDNRLSFEHNQNIEFSFDQSDINGWVYIKIECSFDQDSLDIFLKNKKSAGINVLQGIAKSLDIDFMIVPIAGPIRIRLGVLGSVISS